MQKLEQELWNLKMKGSDIASYIERFSDLALLSPEMVTQESKKVERYIWGLVSPVQDFLTTSRPTTFDSSKKLVYQLNE